MRAPPRRIFRPRAAVLLDPDAWDSPDHLSAEDCLAATGPDWRRRDAAPREQENEQ